MEKLSKGLSMYTEMLLANSPGKIVYSAYIYYHRMETISRNTKQ